jgi:hypothetical protein
MTLREISTYLDPERTSARCMRPAALGGEGDYIGLGNFMGRVSYQYRWRGRAPGSLVVASFVNGRLSSVPTQFGLQ